MTDSKLGEGESTHGLSSFSERLSCILRISNKVFGHFVLQTISLTLQIYEPSKELHLLPRRLHIGDKRWWRTQYHRTVKVAPIVDPGIQLGSKINPKLRGIAFRQRKTHLLPHTALLDAPPYAIVHEFLPVRCIEDEISCRRISQDFSLKRLSKLLVEVQNEHHVNVCNYILGQCLYCMSGSTSKSNIVSIREQSSRRHVQVIFFARLWIRRSFETLLPPSWFQQFRKSW